MVAEEAVEMLRLSKRACRAIAKRRRINVAFDDEVSLSRRSAAEADVGQNDFQFAQYVLRPQLNEFLSLLESLHRVGLERFEPRE